MRRKRTDAKRRVTKFCFFSLFHHFLPSALCVSIFACSACFGHWPPMTPDGQKQLGTKKGGVLPSIAYRPVRAQQSTTVPPSPVEDFFDSNHHGGMGQPIDLYLVTTAPPLFPPPPQHYARHE